MSETIAMPKLGFDMAEGTLVRWVKRKGEAINKGEVLAEIETDKATVEVESTAAGVVAAHLVGEGDIVPVGEAIAVVAAPGEEVDVAALKSSRPAEAEKKPPQDKPAAAPPAEMKQAPSPAPASTAPAAASDGQTGETLASPVARKMAGEAGLDIRLIPGTGPGGRVVKRDVEAFQRRAPAQAPAAEAAGEDSEIPFTRLRQIIGRRMSESKQAAPHFYVTVEIDMAPAMALRQELNGLLPAEAKISVNDFIIKAAALALRETPNLNAAVAGDKLIRRGRVNVGIAVAVEGGLITPVVQDADQKRLAQIAVEARALVGRAREGKIKPADVEGGTFTISNLGMFDVAEFVAIINPPEVAILAVGTVRRTPVVGPDGALAVGTRMSATLSADHRATDGAEAARYLQTFRRLLEGPLQLLL